MAKIIEITGLDRPELQVFYRLTEAQLRARRDPSQAMFIAESPKVIGHAIAAGCQPVAFLMEKKHLEGDAKALIAPWDVPVYTGKREVLAELTGYALTRGVLCAMKRPQQPDLKTVCASARRLAVLEGIVDPTNVGAIFRSAAALGVDGVLVSPTCCDPLHRRAVRVSMGTVFQIPWTRIGAGPEDWPEKGLAYLHGMGFQTAALALTDRAISIEDPVLRQAEKLALILGTEGDGLKPETIAGCSHAVIIPMSHGVDSLNVAAASAVAFWALREH